MSKDITVQITVQEYGPELYKINETGSFIRKELCTVIEIVKHVQPKCSYLGNFAKIGEEWIPKVNVPNKENFEVPANKRCSGWGYLKGNVGDIVRYYDVVSYEKALLEYRNTLVPEPQRKSIGMYDGVEIYEDTKAWFVDLGSFRIIERFLPISTCISYSEDNGIYYSRFYLTPKEANARLKEEILKKAKKKTFTFAELEGFDKYDHTPIGYAIQLIEKEFNVIYLPE